MNFIEATLFVILLAILSVPLATRLRLPLEIFLVIGSGLLSLLPGLPNLAVNPIIVFDLFLPPILFSSAYQISWRDFKLNLRPITLLAFGLALFTTIVVAIIATLLLPGISFTEGLLLGAIVSPSDASSATSIIKKLNASRRLVSILESESLINDATALTLYRFSLLAMIQGSFSITLATETFVLVTIGGALVGLAISYIAVYISQKLNDMLAETTLTFITAFLSYLIAEHIGVSGVISTVVAGIYFGLHFPEVTTTQTRVNAKANWNTILFIINGFVFTLLGFQLPFAIKNLNDYAITQLMLYGLAISLTVITLRLIWVFLAAYLPRKLFPSIEKKDPMPSPQFLFVLGWAGMRGILSLAAAFAIPYNLAPGIPFIHRDLFIFLTYSVILSTLILPALSLPYFLRRFSLTDSDKKIREEAKARIRAMEGVIDKLSELHQKEKMPQDVYDEFIHQIESKLIVIHTQLEDQPYSSFTHNYSALKKLAMTALNSERETLTKLRRTGEIHDEVFRVLSDELDIEELRLKSIRI